MNELNSIAVLWGSFIGLTGAIFWAGRNLVKYGDMLAEKFALGRSLLGIVFIASITSLPELITGVSAVTYAQAPNIATGDVFGSCMFNLLILAFLDGFYRERPLSAQVHHGLTLTAAFGGLMLTLAVLAIVLDDHLPMLGWVSGYSLLIASLYLLAIRIITSYERRLLRMGVHEIAEKFQYEAVPTGQVIGKYALNAVFIVVAATFLPKVAKALASLHQWGETFVGTFFVAFTTSLPEVAVTIAAVRANLVSVAVANLLGSNIFNGMILAMDDGVFREGSLYTYVHERNVVPALFAVMMTLVVICGLIYRAERKPLRLAFESIALICLYGAGVGVLYTS